MGWAALSCVHTMNVFVSHRLLRFMAFVGRHETREASWAVSVLLTKLTTQGLR